MAYGLILNNMFQNVHGGLSSLRLNMTKGIAGWRSRELDPPNLAKGDFFKPYKS